MIRKTISIAAAAVLTVVLLAGCGSPTINRPQKTPGAVGVNVTGSCDIELGGGVITVSGQTDIMNGSLIHVSVVSQDGMIVDAVTFAKTEDAVKYEFAVTSEKYDDSVKKVTGFITCAPSLYGAQPEAVYAVYGKNFENIEGDNIWNNDGIIVLFASETVDFTR